MDLRGALAWLNDLWVGGLALRSLRPAYSKWMLWLYAFGSKVTLLCVHRLVASQNESCDCFDAAEVVEFEVLDVNVGIKLFFEVE